MKRGFVAPLIAVVLELIVFGALLGTALLLPSASGPTVPKTNSSNSAVYFTIVISDSGQNEGMNGSAIKGVTVVWPVINVHVGQKVIINVEMINATEPHGFAIDHYFPAGVTLRSGETYQVTFVANQAGTFRMYCNVFCAIHPLMQNGEVVVK